MDNLGTVSSPEDAVEQLKRDWDKLCIVDHALAVRKIHKSGMSIRGIARELKQQ